MSEEALSELIGKPTGLGWRITHVIYRGAFCIAVARYWGTVADLPWPTSKPVGRDYPDYFYNCSGKTREEAIEACLKLCRADTKWPKMLEPKA